MKAQLSLASNVMDGRLYGSDADFDGVSTDTRTLVPGNLFVALSGPNFDGEAFLDVAADKGAAGAVVTRRHSVDLAQIEVDDTLAALGRLGAAWRRTLPATVIGITGSNGKTTLKELTRSILETVGHTFATRGNLNNEIGVPLTLLDIEPGHEFAVVEMGANAEGDIAYLVDLCEPELVALANAGPAHLEGFGSLDGVARGKGEILSGSPRPGTAVLNSDDNYFEFWKGLAADIDIVSFGLSESADVSAADISLGQHGAEFTLKTPVAERRVRLKLDGKHNVRNACAAAAIATALGVPVDRIVTGLEATAPVDGRLRERAGINGVTLYDDSYNANPTSVAAAAAVLAATRGTTCFILGDMGELGRDADSLHRDTGEAIREAGVDRLLATGPLSRFAVDGFGDGGEWFESIDSLVERASGLARPGLSMLVKGSRAAGMERVVAALAANGNTNREAS